MRAVAMLLVGRFMHVMNGVLDVLRGLPTRLAEEGEEDQPPAVEAGEERRERPVQKAIVPGT